MLSLHRWKVKSDMLGSNVINLDFSQNYLAIKCSRLSFFCYNMKMKKRPFASVIECTLFAPLIHSDSWTPPLFNEHNLMKTQLSAFHFASATAAQLASFSAPIFNTAMRPLIMQGFK